MPKPPRLPDLQLILLSHAAKRDTGSVFPLSDAATSDPARTETELKSLLRRELIIQVRAPDLTSTWRTEDDQRIGLALTDKGCAAIGIDAAAGASVEADAPASVSAAPELASAPEARSNKQADVLMLMQRPEGATLEEMMAATGWLAHSTRAVLTGLRKKGHAIERGKRDDVTCYRIAEAG